MHSHKTKDLLAAGKAKVKKRLKDVHELLRRKASDAGKELRAKQKSRERAVAHILAQLN